MTFSFGFVWLLDCYYLLEPGRVFSVNLSVANSSAVKTGGLQPSSSIHPNCWWNIQLVKQVLGIELWPSGWYGKQSDPLSHCSSPAMEFSVLTFTPFSKTSCQTMEPFFKDAIISKILALKKIELFRITKLKHSQNVCFLPRTTRPVEWSCISA